MEQIPLFGKVTSKKFPPQLRTIRVLHSDKPYSGYNYRRFAFPELTFFFHQKELYVGIESEGFVYPFFFFNIFHHGDACLPGNPHNLEEAIDLFWNSDFNLEVDFRAFPLNKDTLDMLIITWEEKTSEDPGFMKREFDPNHYASRSDFCFDIGDLRSGRKWG